MYFRAISSLQTRAVQSVNCHIALKVMLYLLIKLHCISGRFLFLLILEENKALSILKNVRIIKHML